MKNALKEYLNELEDSALNKKPEPSLEHTQSIAKLKANLLALYALHTKAKKIFAEIEKSTSKLEKENIQ